jgi:MFS family permease
VIALGVTSFFTDVGSEMIFPLLPVFVASLGASATFLGLVEGVADATASLLKLGSGYLADRVATKKPLVLFGYALAALARPCMALAAAPWHVLVVRVCDRIGKGMRTAPRDALLAGAVPSSDAGRAFGLHRAMDHAGAVVGPLIASGLLWLGVPLRYVFAAALVPGLLSLLSLQRVRESAPPRAPEPTAPVAAMPATAAPARLPRRFWSYLGIVLLFSLGNASDAFLLLRARELGVATALLPALWVVLHISKLVFTYLGGAWSDRGSRPKSIVLGFLVYAISYFGLSAAREAWQVWALFVLYGLYYGLTEPSERAIVKDIVPSGAHGRAFGLYNFVVGVSAVPAGLLTGFIWEHSAPEVALSLGAGIAGIASAAMLFWARTSAAGP